MEEFLQKKSASYISAVSETNKLLASWRLAQYYGRKEKKTLQLALYRWNRIIGSMMMSKDTKQNKRIEDNVFLETATDAKKIENRNLKFKAFLFRTKRCYKNLKDRDKDLMQSSNFRINSIKRGNRNRRANEDFQINLAFPDVFMKKVRINSKVRIDAPLNFKFVCLWVNGLFKKHAYIKTKTIFDLGHAISENDFTYTKIDNTVENFIENVLHLDKLDVMPYYLVKTPVQHNIKLIDHGLKYENELNASSYYPLWEKSCAFVQQYKCQVPNLFRLGLICLELLTRAPLNFTVNISAYQERHRDTVIRALLQAILCRICLCILNLRNDIRTDGDKLVSKPITNFKSESQVYSAKEHFFHYFEPMVKNAHASPELQQAIVVRDVKPFRIHNRFSIAQKDTPKRINLDNAYIYSTTDPDDHATLYKVQYKNPIESCPKEMHEKIRFNIVGRSYIDSVNPGTENHLQYVKCFPNVKNMMQRSFFIWKNATLKNFYARVKQETLENANLIRYNLKPSCDMLKFKTKGLKLATKYVQRAFHVKTIDKASKSLQKDIAELSQKLNSLSK